MPADWLHPSGDWLDPPADWLHPSENWLHPPIAMRTCYTNADEARPLTNEASPSAGEASPPAYALQPHTVTTFYIDHREEMSEEAITWRVCRATAPWVQSRPWLLRSGQA